MAKGDMPARWNMRVVLMTSVVGLIIAGLLLFMYPKIIQALGFAPPQQLATEQFESDTTKAGDKEDGDQDGEEDGEEDGESDFEDGVDDETDDELDDETDYEDEEDETDGDDELDGESAEEDTDDESVSVGTGSNIDVGPGDSREGFSMLKQAPKASPPQSQLPGQAPGQASGQGTPDASTKRLIVMHATWCGHCKTLLASSGPWKQVKKALPGVTIDELDESRHPDLVKALGVQSFPTIMILDSANQNAIPYEGPRTKDGIVDFALRNIQPNDL